MKREQATEEILAMKNPYILLELPTSYGKSKIALELLAKRKVTSSILIVVPRLVLIDTWKNELCKWGFENLVPAVEFVTYVSLPKKAGKWNLVIFDECHHLSQRCRESLKSFSIKNAFLLSATVKRELRGDIKILFPNLGIYKVTVKNASSAGVLPDPKVYLVPMLLDNREVNQAIIRNPKKGSPVFIEYRDKFRFAHIKNRKVVIRCTQQQYYNDISGLVDWYKRKKSINKVMKNLWLHTAGERLKWLSDQKTDIVKKIIAKFPYHRTLTFCNSIAQTEELGEYCINSKNKKADFYLSKFNRGKINHITACNMLDEGVNLSDCQVGVYACLNASDRMIIQKLGRLLRHQKPVIIIPYFKFTRDEEIVRKMCQDYNPDLIKVVYSIDEITL